MNPHEFLTRRFGIAPPIAKTYFEAMQHLTDKDPAEIVRDYCPMDFFHINIISSSEMVHNCMQVSCADCWQNKYKGENPR